MTSFLFLKSPEIAFIQILSISFEQEFSLLIKVLKHLFDPTKVQDSFFESLTALQTLGSIEVCSKLLTISSYLHQFLNFCNIDFIE